MSTSITTRQTAGTGATVKGAPLSNAEVDNNFIGLNQAVQPAGGTAGQILAKIDATNFNSQWIDNYATQVKLEVKNSTGTTLNKGSVVYVSGGAGANALVSLALASGDSTSATTIGFLESTLANGDVGLVVATGVIAGIDTSLALEGDPVWLSPTTPGGVVFGLANKPQAPNHIVYLGTVTRAHATVGEIQIHISNGWELDELHDVQITGKANNDIIQYNSALGVWKNVTPATARTNLGLAIGTNVQAWDADLDAIAGLTGTSGFLKKTAANTWLLDTNTYLTGNQSITVSGDATGSGTTAITLTLANSGVAAGTYTKVTVDAKGRVTTGTSLSSSDVTTALGYTPYNSTNPSGYITSSGNAATTSQRNFSGDISATGQGRFTGWYTGNAATGFAAEIGVSAGQGYIFTYNRDTGTYGTLNIAASAANMQFSGSTINVNSGALQQGGNQVLHAGNYSSYALPLSGGTLSGAIRAPQITAGGSTNTDVQFGVQGTSHLAGDTYLGGSVGNVNSWSARLTSSGGTTTLSSSRFVVDRFGYGSQPLIDAQLSLITLGQPTRIEGGIRQGADMARPLAQWSATSATGMVYFELPGNTGNHGMVHAVIDIYEYSSNSVSTVIVGGHNWSGAWYNVGANVIGQTDKAVRLGVRGGKYVICIGSAGSSWSYGTVVLRKIHNGGYYSGIMDMGAAFAAAITTSESLTWDSGDLRNLRTPAGFNAGGAITQNGNQVLHAGNYNSYSPSLTGGGASGTWGINITGTSRLLAHVDGPRNLSDRSPSWSSRTAVFDFVGAGAGNGTGNYAGILTFVPWDGTSASTGDSSYQLSFANQSGVNASGPARLSIRNGINSTWNSWQEILSSSNFSSYALPLSGGELNGSLRVNTSGSGSTTSHVIIKRSGQTPASFGIYSGSWRSSLEIWNNDSTKMLFLNSAENDSGYANIKSVGGGFFIDVGSSGATRAIQIEASGAANFPQSLTQGGNQVLHAGNSTSYPAASAPLLSAVGNYSFSASTNGRDFSTGVQAGFVSDGQGYPSYGSVVRVKTFPNDGGTAELYFPYSSAYGGSAMRYRLGQYDNAGWTGWKTVLDSSNYTSYSPGYTGSSGALRVQTGSGYVDIGPMNSSWSHFQTDRGQFYFGSPIYVDGNIGHYSSGNNDKRYTKDNSHLNLRDPWGNLHLKQGDGGGFYADASEFHLRPGDGLTDWLFVNSGSFNYKGNAVLHAGNYTSYALPLSGGTLTGPLTVSESGHSFRIDPHASGVDLHSTGNLAPHYQTNVTFYTGAIGSGTQRWSLDASGNMTASGNVTAYSDERLKKDWASPSLDFVQRLAQIKSGTYTRIDSEERQAGASAQDWQALLPEVVSAGADGILSLAYGNAALVSAIELAKRVVDQEARIKRLESLINKLIGD